MKKLNFQPHKSKKSFHTNYHLHDLAEKHGKNLLIQWGVGYEEFGKDLRNEKVWEKGKDKPDLIIKYKMKSALLDWKGKHDSVWKINKRAFDSYLVWGKKLDLQVIIAFALFDNNNILIDFLFSKIRSNNYIISNKKEWDKNDTVVFTEELPAFTKANILKAF